MGIPIDNNGTVKEVATEGHALPRDIADYNTSVCLNKWLCTYLRDRSHKKDITLADIGCKIISYNTHHYKSTSLTGSTTQDNIF